MMPDCKPRGSCAGEFDRALRPERIWRFNQMTTLCPTSAPLANPNGECTCSVYAASVWVGGVSEFCAGCPLTNVDFLGLNFVPLAPIQELNPMPDWQCEKTMHLSDPDDRAS